MKRIVMYGSIVVLILLAFWLFRGSRNAVVDECPRKPRFVTETVIHENASVPDDDTPPIYLTLEQQLNPTLGRPRKSTPEEKEAQYKGAKTKFKVCVVDSMRIPVPDANVEVSFFPHDLTTRDTHAATSDGDGLCSFEGITTAYVFLKATKEGYYTTDRQHYFYVYNATQNCIKEGRWQPWNATLELVMKEKRDPTALYVKCLEIHFPQKGISYGFDCVVGDLVEPHGKGKIADLIFTHTGERRTPQDYNLELRIETVNGGGFIRGASDMWSELKTPYTAPESGYAPEIVLWERSIPDVSTEGTYLKLNEYLVFETYSRGEQPCVGKIYGELFINRSFKYPEGGSTSFLLYYFNPVPGDRRIESDPDQNLFGKPTRNILQQP